MAKPKYKFNNNSGRKVENRWRKQELIKERKSYENARQFKEWRQWQRKEKDKRIRRQLIHILQRLDRRYDGVGLI